MKIREGPIWILMTLFHSLSVSLLFQGLYAGWLIFLFNYFQLEKNRSVELGPASHGEGRRKRLASYLLKCWKPPSHSARQRNGLCPVLVRDVCTFSSHRIFCLSKGFWALWTKRWSKATRAFPTAPSQPACSVLWMRIWETPKSLFHLGDSKVSTPPVVLVSFSNKPQVQHDAGILTPSGWGGATAGPCEKRAFGKTPLATLRESRSER